MLDKILQTIERIPAFPATVRKVEELLAAGDYSAAQLARVIELDQAIAAQIIKMSNSAYFGVRQPIRSIMDAVTYLGQENIIRAVRTAGISKFYHGSVKGYVPTALQLWEHSVAVALMSQILFRKLYQRKNHQLYTAALLHDVGKLVMGEFVNESFQKVMDLVIQHGRSFLEAEEEIIGINHAEAGRRIAEHWKFPEDIKEAIAFHHRPDLLEKENKVIPWLVYLSDQICLMTGIGVGEDGLAYRGLGEAIEKFNLRMRDIEESIVELTDQLKAARGLVNIE
jgi:putative nucleotidyltransferase with HDIG domain